MADPKFASAAGSDAEVFLSASEDEAVQQEVTPELLSALVKQVEFYFSDANLPTDKKLLKQIRKDPEGFVPVKLFANFRKVRALSKDVAIITESLRNATLLQLSEDAKRVKRLVTVPDYDISDIQRRTIVVENLPAVPSPTIESVTDAFRLYGRVKLVRICSRESKGKLPSWLTSSCQNMGGQHAYVEFEDEEGAVLAAAALASEFDAPDGAVQVRRLLACIAEHRERRSGAGAGHGSSFGGSSANGCSRKGSRDVSPLGSRVGVSSRRGSHGGVSHGGMSHGGMSSSGGAAMSYGGGTYSSCGGASSAWASSGGAVDSAFYHAHSHAQPHHHSYGGAYEHFAGSRRGSGGGAPSCGGAGVPLPPPPPPPRRSCDSAPPSELLQQQPAAVSPVASSAPVPMPAAAPVPARLNIYRPPGKRLSDGAHGLTAASPLIRSSGGSFTSGGSSHCGSAASTPTASLLPSPMLGAAQQSAGASSPPLATRIIAATSGRPPVPHAAAVAHVTAVTKPEHHPSALAEAIAAAAAERRASEAGAKAAEAAPATAVAAAPVAVAVVSRPPASAPKFCLDLSVPSSGAATGPQLRRTSSSGPELLVSPSTGAAMAPKMLRAAPMPSAAAHAAVTAAAAPRATQMVADVEGFINNILASSIPGPRAANVQQQQQPRAKAAQAPKQLYQQDAAATVAGILASALRKPAAAAPAPASTATAGVKPPAAPMIFITAVVDGDDMAGLHGPAMMEHAVTVNVHLPVASAACKTVSSTSSSGSPREEAGEQQPQQGTKHVSKYSPNALRCSAGGLGSGQQAHAVGGSASISDGGAVHVHGNHVAPSAMWHVARGPDGSRGFGRSGRA